MVEVLRNTFMIAVAAMAISGCNVDHRFLYYPSSSLPSEQLLAAQHMRFWPSSAHDYRGLIGSPEVGNPKGTIIIFHGNGGTAADRGFYMTVLDRGDKNV